MSGKVCWRSEVRGGSGWLTVELLKFSQLMGARQVTFIAIR